MMNGFGAAVMADRTRPRETRAFARYLAAEYGADTGPGFVEAVGRRASRKSRHGHGPARRRVLLAVLEVLRLTPGRRKAAAATSPSSDQCGGSEAHAGG